MGTALVFIFLFAFGFANATSNDSLKLADEAPVVTVTSPLNGTTVSGNIPFTADASDDNGIAGVLFVIDDFAYGDEDTSAPYGVDLDTTLLSNGWHYLDAIARSNDEGLTTSFGTLVYVDNVGSSNSTDITPPEVFITSPLNGQVLSGLVFFSANSSDLSGISHVDFYIDGEFVNNDAVFPYESQIDTNLLFNGYHTLSATAWDNADNSQDSVPISVLVDNSGDAGNSTDITPPSSISSLSISSITANSLAWIWENPLDSDFSHSNVYIDGEFATETSNSFYEVSGLEQNTSHTITVNTVDLSGNVNTFNVSDTQITASEDIGNRTISTCTIIDKNSGDNEYPDKVNVIANCTNPQATPILYRNGVQLSSLKDTSSLGAGTYNYEVRVIQTQDYTSASAGLVLEVAKGDPTLSLPVSPGLKFSYPAYATIEGTSCPSQLSCKLYLDGNEVSNSHSQLLSLGMHEATYSTDGNENYTAETIIKKINVTVNSNQRIAVNESESFDSNISEIVLPDGFNVTNIFVPSVISQDQKLIINFAFLFDGHSLIVPTNLTLTRESSAGTYTVLIPAGTVITPKDDWDGKLDLFTLANSSLFNPPSGTLNSLVTIGTNDELRFSNPVMITLNGKAGQTAAWSSSSNGTLTKISTVCDSLSNPGNINSNSSRECSIVSGSDLVIWTYHFTTYGTYTEAANPSNGGGGGGGGSSSSSSGGSGHGSTSLPSYNAPQATPTGPTWNVPENESDVNNGSSTSGQGKISTSPITGAIVGAIGKKGVALVVIFLIVAVLAAISVSVKKSITK